MSSFGIIEENIELSHIHLATQPLNMPHFKGLGMRNLQYEIRIFQKL